MPRLGQKCRHCRSSLDKDWERCAARQGLAAGLPEVLTFSLAPRLPSHGTWLRSALLCFKPCTLLRFPGWFLQSREQATLSSSFPYQVQCTLVCQRFAFTF